MKAWNEVRTAACVARLGTVNAAATELGIHRASVNRHVETLENQLGAKLFIRHGRGYTPTPLGLELLRMADATSAHFGELERKAKEDTLSVEGIFNVTLVADLVPVLLPTLKIFRDHNPKVDLNLIGEDRVLKLEYGEADVAVRIGAKPDHPDNVVLPLTRVRMGFYGPTEFDMPTDLTKLPDRCVVGPTDQAPSATYFDWLKTEIPSHAIGLRSNSIPAMWDAVRLGFGVGFLPHHRAKGCDLVELIEAQDEWHEQVWLVTHADMHRSAKIQALVRAAKQATM